MLKVAPAKRIKTSPTPSPSSSPFELFSAYFSGKVPMDSTSEEYTGDESYVELDSEDYSHTSPLGSPVLHQYSSSHSNLNDLQLRAQAYQLAEEFKRLASTSPLMDKELINEAGARILVPYLPTLRGSSWFSDIIVSRWFDYLSDRHANTTNIHSTELPNTYLQEISEEGGKQEDRSRLQQADTIFWPLVDNNHWYLLIIERRPNNYVAISCMDGFNTFEKHNAIFQIADRLLKAIYSQTDYDSLVRSYDSLTIPRQTNGDDCGPAICYQALNICERKSRQQEMSCSDYQQARLMIAQTLLQAYTTSHTFINGYFPHGRTDKKRRTQPNRTSQPVIEIDDDAASIKGLKLI